MYTLSGYLRECGSVYTFDLIKGILSSFKKMHVLRKEYLKVSETSVKFPNALW